MARKLRSPRFPVANGGGFYDLVPVHRSIVTPGETLKKLRCTIKLQSLPVKFPLQGAYVDMWFFYVPLRACWPGWEDFILGNTDVTVPTLTGSQRRFFEAGTDKSNLFGMAYQEIVNLYFRENDFIDIGAVTGQRYVYDGDTGGYAALPSIDRTCEMRVNANVDEDDETVDVSGGSLSVLALKEAQAKQRWNEQKDRASGKYVDFLRSFGVNAAESMAAVPEHLGKYRKFVMPSRAVDDQTGATVQSFFHEAEVTLNRRRFFPEHGFLVGVMAIRPKLHRHSHGAFDSLFTEAEDWPMAGQPSQLRRKYGPWGALTDTAFLTEQESSADFYLKYGQHLMGVDDSADSMFAVDTPASTVAWAYPLPYQVDFLTAPSTLPDAAAFQFDGVTSLTVASPMSLDRHQQRVF